MPKRARRRPLDAESDALVRAHLPLVRKVAARLKRRLPANADMDELVSAGVIGLIEATANYDAKRADQFGRFAEFRIQGAMLDDWRATDTLSRDMRRLSNELQDATGLLVARLGRKPDHAELAAAVGMTGEDLAAAFQKLSGWSVVGIDDAGPGLLDRIPDPSAADPFDHAVYLETVAAIEAAVATLPEKIRAAAALRYREGWQLKEIAAALGYTESRACQVMRLIEAAIRDALALAGIEEAI